MTDLDIIKQLEQKIGKKLYETHIRDVMHITNSYAMKKENILGLNLNGNGIEAIPSSIFLLKKLLKLSINNNRIKEIPIKLTKMENLISLDISSNKLSYIPKEISQLQKVTYLNLANNQIQRLPVEIIHLKDTCQLYTHENPLVIPPLEISMKGFVEISNFFNSLGLSFFEYFDSLENISEKYLLKYIADAIQKEKQRQEKIDNFVNSFSGIYPLTEHEIRLFTSSFPKEVKIDAKIQAEIKVLVLGQGGAGKTSLIKRLIFNNFDANEKQTHGVNIQDWQIINKDNKETVQLHLWDFGGQETMHATHQFFLSKRSLYILVLDGRKEEKHEYWLKQIESFGKNSPVLVVLNKIDENPDFEVNQPFLRKKYKNIYGFYRISCKDKIGINEFQQAISKTLTKVKILQTIWAQSWFEVKTKLENLEKYYISHKEYKNLCATQNIDQSAQDTLIQFLHDLGVIIHFKDFDLRDTYVLEPKWVTEAVYKIINAPQLAESHGVLKLEWLDDILEPKNENDYKYPIDKYRYIILLMEKFELCYKICKQTILIPDLLPVAQPSFDFDYDNALKFKFEYDFLPRSIMPKFIVKRNTDILNQLQWRTGVVLYDKTCQATAVIKADNEDRNIQIWVTGQQKRDYFATIRKTLWDLHNEFEKLDVIELVPLPDKDKRGQTVYVEYEELIGLYLDNETIFHSGKLRKKYNIKQLLDGIVDMDNSQQVRSEIHVYGDVNNSNLNNAGNNNEQYLK
ncbi:COR domain-containing protein [Candidatus Albibeggiatoa sp. nov. NOAA]|uniref:COR domain-containing protein n=1 Tax=Candidatus Albibeggiatoa sp. nov. NOAA TaxID=3162724 RepID=UPI003301F20C|nr:GTP-binding protein [Thiotrichaceae bacterium]